MKKNIIFLFFLFTLNSIAQDYIVKSSGDTIRCRIVSIDTTQIWFLHYAGRNVEKDYLPLNQVQKYHIKNQKHHIEIKDNNYRIKVFKGDHIKVSFDKGDTLKAQILEIRDSTVVIKGLSRNDTLTIGLDSVESLYVKRRRAGTPMLLLSGLLTVVPGALMYTAEADILYAIIASMGGIFISTPLIIAGIIYYVKWREYVRSDGWDFIIKNDLRGGLK